MMKNGDMPAIGHAGRIDEDGFACAPGLTKRELFAAMAMQGLLSNPGGPVQASDMSGWKSCVNCTRSIVALEAIEFADAILAELDRAA